MEFPWFMLFYGLTFMVIGIFIGYYLKEAIHVLEMDKLLKWTTGILNVVNYDSSGS